MQTPTIAVPFGAIAVLDQSFVLQKTAKDHAAGLKAQPHFHLRVAQPEVLDQPAVLDQVEVLDQLDQPEVLDQLEVPDQLEVLGNLLPRIVLNVSHHQVNVHMQLITHVWFPGNIQIQKAFHYLHVHAAMDQMVSTTGDTEICHRCTHTLQH